jgi:hypothetical protein
MTSKGATTLAYRLYKNWVDCLKGRDYIWLQRHLAEDFLFTSYLTPGPAISRTAFLEGVSKVRNADIRFLSVWAEQADKIILSHIVLDVEGEITAALGPGTANQERVARALNGRELIYASAWRRHGDDWECFTHHEVAYAD